MGKGQKRFHEPKSAEKPSEQGKETNRQLPQASDEAKGSPQHKAFKEMLRRCDSTIFKICLMFTDRCPENVKDLYQDIVCALWESWPRFRHESKENTWVYRIALNIAVSKSRHHSLSPMFSPLDDKTYNNLAEESQNHLVERLYELIDLLSPNEKAILFLYLKSADIKNTTSATANIVEEEPKTEAIPTPQTTTAKPKCGTIECQDWCDNQEILAELNYIIETSYKV